MMQLRGRDFGQWLALSLVVSLLAGCSTPSWLCLLPPGPDNVTLVTSPTTNVGAAMSVDLVLISDRVAATQISALSAADWFTQRPQLERDFPKALTVRSWGLAPGQVARDQPADPVCNRVATILFARYAAPGAHRIVLAPTRSIEVLLGDDDFAVSP